MTALKNIRDAISAYPLATRTGWEVGAKEVKLTALVAQWPTQEPSPELFKLQQEAWSGLIAFHIHAAAHKAGTKLSVGQALEAAATLRAKPAAQRDKEETRVYDRSRKACERALKANGVKIVNADGKVVVRERAPDKKVSVTGSDKPRDLVPQPVAEKPAGVSLIPQWANDGDALASVRAALSTLRDAHKKAAKKLSGPALRAIDAMEKAIETAAKELAVAAEAQATPAEKVKAA